MKNYGSISKLSATLNNPILYKFNIGDSSFDLNNFIGKTIKIDFNGEINCIECGSKIIKTFMQGFCYPCFIKSPRTSECIFKPHLCRAHDGKARDMEWSKQYCLSEQFVYLSLTSNLKVGVTRENHIPSRWIDQGAHFAIKFAKAPNRYLAGMIEIELSKYISDRTKWHQMIQGKYDMIDLIDKKNELINSLPKDYQQYVISENNLVELQYPLNASPEKIKSFNLDKNPELYGELTGIKGQYLIIDNEIVLNIRKYTGYNSW